MPSKTHGATSGGKWTKEYRSWHQIKQRCLNKNNPDFKNYGGRGISICQRWADSFSNFLSDMGKCPEGHSIDRINNNSNYEPTNCRWATQLMQMANTRKNVYLTLNGKRKHLSWWARQLGVECSVLEYRYKRGWSTEQILCRESGRWKWDRRKILINISGKKMSITEISDKFGIPKSTIFYRLKNGLKIIPKDVQNASI